MKRNQIKHQKLLLIEGNKKVSTFKKSETLLTLCTIKTKLKMMNQKADKLFQQKN